MTETPATEQLEDLPPLTPDEYAANVLAERVRTLADQSGLLLGEGQGYVDSRWWGVAITDRLVAQGWTPPEDVPEREPGDVYRDGYPLEVTALKDMAVAYNSLMWRLAVAMGLANEGDGIVDLNLEQLGNEVVAMVTDAYTGGVASTGGDPS